MEVLSGEGEAGGAEWAWVKAGAPAGASVVGRNRVALDRVKGGEKAIEEVGDGGADAPGAAAVVVPSGAGDPRGVGDAGRVAPSDRDPKAMLGRIADGAAGAAEAALRGGGAAAADPGPDASSSSQSSSSAFRASCRACGRHVSGSEATDNIDARETHADKVDQAGAVHLTERRCEVGAARSCGKGPVRRGARLRSGLVEHGLHEFEDLLQCLSLSANVRCMRGRV